MKRFRWAIFAFFAIVIGLYPFAYLMFDMRYGFLATKSPALLQTRLWQWGFYQHILFGSVALLTGWSQFGKQIRNRFVKLHRNLGRIYVFSVFVSGSAGLFIAFYATGGIIASSGFSALALSWVFTTFFAYTSIRRKEIDNHRYWMLRSYALCFAAVTLRIWLPLFQFGLGLDFSTAYKIIAWLCWVPNIIVAEIIIRNLKASPRAIKMGV